MKIALIARSTLYDVPGGDTVQIIQTARHLQLAGAEATVCLTHEAIRYAEYDLFHFFNITRPADILYHLRKITKPYIITPILVDYSEYDKYHRGGFTGLLFRVCSSDRIEYLKTVFRWIKGNDTIRDKSYLVKGQRRTIRFILEKAVLLLPNSLAEYSSLLRKYAVSREFMVVPNGTDASVFKEDNGTEKDKQLVLCVARIEGIKNQYNLIKAVKGTSFQLVIIGALSPNQHSYYHQCLRTAGANVTFTGRLSPGEIAAYYAKAKVHVLPSWFETCGLSSLEAAAMGCNVVITNKGYTEAYFGPHAFYCNPGDTASIRQAIEEAAAAGKDTALQNRIQHEYTWEKAAAITLEGYKKAIAGLEN